MKPLQKLSLNLKSLPRRQRGMATVLTSLFIGLAVTATSLSILHSIRSTQERQLSVHAQTHPQQAVWTGVEAVRLHLANLTKDELDAFEAAHIGLANKFSIGGMDATVDAWLTGNKVDNSILDSDDNSFNVAVKVQAEDSAALSSSIVEVVYKVVPLVDAGPQELDTVAVYNGDVDYQGGININGEGAGEIHVKGNFTASGSVGGSGLHHVKVTGDALIKSDIDVKTLTSNGNVVLKGSAKASIYAAGYPGLGKGNILSAADSATSTNLYANGNIKLTNTSKHSYIKARGTIETLNNSTSFGSLLAANSSSADDYFPVVLAEGITFEEYLEEETAEGSALTTDYSSQLKAGKRPYFEPSATIYPPYIYSADNNYFTGLNAALQTAINENLALFNPLNLETLNAPNTNPEAYTVNKVTLAQGTYTDIYSKGLISIAMGALVYKDVVTVNDDTTTIATDENTGKIVSEIGVLCGADVTIAGKVQAPKDTVACAGVGTDPEDYTQTVDEFPEVARFTEFEAPHVDVAGYKQDAHYAFEYDDSTDKMKVTVRGIKGIGSPLDETFYLGKIVKDFNKLSEHICKSVNSSGYCDHPDDVAEAKPMCGLGVGATCFTYSDGLWTVVGSEGLAPGVLWFEGDLALTNGRLFNSILATGNITTSGDFRSAAINFVNEAPIPVCSAAGAFTHKGVAMADASGGKFAGQYPTDYCPDGAATTLDGPDDYQSLPMGNVALMAGSYDSDHADYLPYPNQEAFVGGVITIGSSSAVMGTVMSAHVLKQEGAGTVYGLVSASGQGSSAEVNSVGGSGGINTDNLPKGYGTDTPPPVNPDGESGSSKVLWSRYP